MPNAPKVRGRRPPSTASKLSWERRGSLVEANLPTVLRALHELTTLVIEYVASAEVGDPPELGSDRGTLLHLHAATDGPRSLQIVVNVLLERRERRRREAHRARLAQTARWVADAARGLPKAARRTEDGRAVVADVLRDSLHHFGLLRDPMVAAESERIRACAEYVLEGARCRFPLFRGREGASVQLRADQAVSLFAGEAHAEARTIRRVRESLMGRTSKGPLGAPGEATAALQDDDHFLALDWIIQKMTKQIVRELDAGTGQNVGVDQPNGGDDHHR